MLDDEDQFIMTPYLEGRANNGGGGRDSVCASLNRFFQWNRGLFQWSLRNPLLFKTH